MAIVGVYLASGQLIEDVTSLGYAGALEANLQSILAVDQSRQAAVNDCLVMVIGVLESLRDWRARGLVPVEIHQPERGLWVRPVAGGWEMVYAPLALGVRFDGALNPASIELEFFADWYAAMRAVQSDISVSGLDGVRIKGLGRIGGGGAPSGPPPFWTRHVLSREAIE